MTMQIILRMMDMELMALDSPTSSFSSAVNAGTMDAMGLKARMARACRISRRNGKRK